MRLLVVAGDAEALITHIRLRTPLQALVQNSADTLSLRSMRDCTARDLAAADVLIVQRGLTRRAWRLERQMRLLGKAVIYEIDDLLTEVPSHISNHARIRQAQPWLRRCLAECDLVTASTHRLAQALALPAAQAVHVVPNCAWPAEPWPPLAEQPGQVVTLLLASMEHLSTDFIHAALRAVQGPGVRIVAVGPPAAGLAAAGVEVQAQALLPREDFLAFARSLPNPVAVIPLEASRFAACKSAVKWFEYAGAGIPVLCSNVPPYADVVRQGLTGELVDNTSEAWRLALCRAVTDAGWRARVAAAAQADVQQRFSLAHTVSAWRQAIQLAIEQRARFRLEAPAWAERLQLNGWSIVDALARQARQFRRQRRG